MKFDSKQDLANHKKKFCVTSDYGSVDRLEQKFSQIDSKAKPYTDLNVNMASVNEYLKGPTASILEKNAYGNMTLEELREYFQSDQETFAELQKKAAQRRDQEVDNEIEDLKKERQMLKLQKAKDDQELGELMQVLETKKEKELRAKIEKEKIAAELQVLDRGKLGYVEEEKKQELQRLAAEREAIKKKEEDIMAEISAVSSKMKEKEQALQRDKEALALRKDKATIQREELRKKEAEFAKERAVKIAELKHRREMLEQEKAQVAQDLDAVKAGNVEVLKKGLTKPILLGAAGGKTDGEIVGLVDPEKRQQLIQEKARIEQLKEEIRRTNAELIPEITPLDTMNEIYKVKDLPRMTGEYVGALIAQNKDNPKKLAQDLSVVRSHLEQENGVAAAVTSKITPPEFSKAPVMGGLGQLPGYARQEVKREPAKLPPTKPKLKPAARESQLPVPQEEPPLQDPPVPAPPIIPQQPNGFGYSPYIPQTMSQMAPIGDPFLMQSLVDIKEKIAKTLEKNQTLEGELKKLKDSKTAIKTANAKTPVSPPIKKMIDLPAPSDTKFAQNEDRAEDLEAEEKALLNVAAQEYDALQMLSTLDPGSELYKYKLQQYKDMSAYRAEIEKALQRQRLERLRFDFEVQKKKMSGIGPTNAAPEELGTVERLKKESIVGRLQKEYEAQNPDHPPAVYDPATGLNVGFDFGYNLPADVAKLQVVYGVFANGVPVTELQQAGPIPAKLERDSKASCVMSFNKTLKDVPAMPEVQLIAEVQGIDRSGKQFNIGWTFIDLFDAANKLNNGLHKLPILKPPTLDHVSAEDMAELSRFQDSTLYTRVAHTQGDYTFAAPVTPANKNLYTLPECHHAIPLDSDPTGEPQQMLSVEPVPYRQPTGGRPEPASAIPPMPSLAVNVPLAIPPTGKRTALPPIGTGLKSALPQPAPQIRPRSMEQKYKDLRGVKVHIHNVKSVACQRPFKMNVSIIEENKVFAQPSTGEPATYDTGVYNPPAVAMGGKVVTPNPQSEVGVVPLIPINDGCQFVGNVYQLRKTNPAKPNYYLLIQKVDKSTDTGRSTKGTAIPSSYTVTSYAVMKLHNEDETLNYGDFQIPFYPAPVAIPPTAKPLLGTVSFTIDDLPKTAQKPPALPKATTPVVLVPQKGQPMKPLVPKNAVKLPAMPPIEEDKREHLPVLVIDNVKPIAGVELAPGESFAVYVDGMRFIPANCGPIKVNLRGYTSTLERNMEESYMFPLWTSTVSMPAYNQKRVVQNSPALNPTTLLLGSLEMFDCVINKDRILGYFVINAFVDPATGRPVSSVAGLKGQAKLHEGNFQLPICCDNPFTNPFTMSRVKRMDAVPGASVLVRIKKVAGGAGESEYPPEYKSGVYLTNYYDSPEKDRQVMAERAAEDSVTIKEAIQKWRAAQGVQTPLTEKEAYDWLRTHLKAAANTNIFEYKFFDQYSPDVGLKIFIEGFHNAPTQLPLVTCCTFNPTAEGAFVFSTINMDSPQRSMRYSYEAKVVMGVNPAECWQLVLDIRSVQIEDGAEKVVEWGWSVLPLFDRSHGGTYINTGIFMLPVYKAPIPKQVLPDLAKAADPFVFLNDLAASSTAVRHVEPMSVIVTVKDPRYTGDFEYKRFNKSAIPKDALSRYDYNIHTHTKLEAAPKMSGLVPEGELAERYQARITAAAEKHFGLAG